MSKMMNCKACNARNAKPPKACPQCGAKHKKPIYVRWLLRTLTVIVVISISLANVGCSTNAPANGTTPGASSAAPESVKQPKEEKRLTLEKYNKTQNGMTYKEVIDIIGFEISPETEVGEKGSQFYTVSYRYMGGEQVKGSLGANASFMFQGGKLSMKAQVGLD